MLWPYAFGMAIMLVRKIILPADKYGKTEESSLE
jgi:hypothetical protein